MAPKKPADAAATRPATRSRTQAGTESLIQNPENDLERRVRSTKGSTKGSTRPSSRASSAASDNGLTKKREVILASVQANTHLEETIGERDELIASLTRERDEARKQNRSRLRDYMLAKKLQAETPAQTTPAQPETAPARSPVVEEAPAPEPQAHVPSPVAETPVVQSAVAPTPGWKALVNSVGGIFKSPFARKRPAPVEETPAQTPTQKRARTERSERRFMAPSTKHPRVPTSLSTVTEYSERTDATITAPDTTPTRPSKRKVADLSADLVSSDALAIQSEGRDPNRFTTPRRGQVFNVPNFMPSGSQQSQQSQSPAKMTPHKRLVKDVRAAQLARAQTPQRPKAWESNPKPKETNADARLTKLQKLEQLKKEQERLEREMQELNRDQDVQEIVGHRRKRVKVDDLISIPARRPQDPEGTYGFPDIDSDDEIEVDEDEPVRTNVFEEAQTQDEQMQEQQATAATAMDTPEPSKTMEETSAAAGMKGFGSAEAKMPVAPATPKTTSIFAPSPAMTTTDEQMQASPKYNWPSVARRLPEHDSTEEDKIAGARKFERLFSAWIEAGEHERKLLY